MWGPMRQRLFPYSSESLISNGDPDMESSARLYLANAPIGTCLGHSYLKMDPVGVYLIRFDLSGDVYYFYTYDAFRYLRYYGDIA